MRMFSGNDLRRFSQLKLALLGLLTTSIIGCGNISPYLAGQFNTTFPGVPVTGGGVGGGGNDNGAVDVYEFLDQIPVGLRTFSYGVANSAPFPARQRALFVVTAGDGGFVQDDDTILDYIAAGYRDIIPPGSPIGTTATLGCVPIRLTRGTRLLAKTAGDVQGVAVFYPPNLSGEADNFTGPIFDIRNDDQDPNIPIPEFVVFATDDPNFECAIPTQACTQEAFRFFDIPQIQEIGKAVTSARIQGTVCNLGLGQSPEYRLDRTNDGNVTPFQFVPGCTIVMRILDRQFDAPEINRVQVVWNVFDAEGNVVHIELP